MIGTQFDKKIKLLRSDNGGEYLSSTFGSYLNQHGIIHQNRCPSNPKQNGVAECKNRYLLEIAKALMFEMNVPKFFWANAVQTIAFFMNRFPTQMLGYKSPFEMVSPTSPLFPIPPRSLVVFVLYILTSLPDPNLILKL